MSHDTRFAVYCPNDGWEGYAEEDEAIDHFDALIEEYTDAAADGWHDDIENLALFRMEPMRTCRLVKTAEAGDGSSEGMWAEAHSCDFVAHLEVEERRRIEPGDIVTWSGPGAPEGVHWVVIAAGDHVAAIAFEDGGEIRVEQDALVSDLERSADRGSM